MRWVGRFGEGSLLLACRLLNICLFIGAAFPLLH